MKREIFILVYVIVMGTFIVTLVTFLSQLAIYFFGETASQNYPIPFKSLFHVSIKVGLVGGIVGGVGTWLMHFFNHNRH